MKQQAQSVVIDFLTAIQQGNFPKLGELLHEDITWNQPGNSVVSGVKNSKAAVFQMVGTMFQKSSNTLTLAGIKSVTINNNQVACLLNWKATDKDGNLLDTDNIDLYTVVDGQITEAQIFAEDISAEDNFWGQA
jgi:ketosteroid isomerase-like protein